MEYRGSKDIQGKNGSSNAALAGILGVRAMSEMSKILGRTDDSSRYLVSLLGRRPGLLLKTSIAKCDKLGEAMGNRGNVRGT
jgi:hypothetical protein